MFAKFAPAALAAGLLLAAPGLAAAAELKAPGGGTVHALVMGINDYPNLGARASLRGARPDAEDIAAVLKKEGVTDLTPLYDHDVTRKRVVTEMNKLVQTSKAGDLVIISYSGHGMQVPEYKNWQGLNKKGVNEQIALSGFDFQGRGADEVVVNVEVRAWLSRLDAKGVDTLVVWDSCFGGGMRGVPPAWGEIKVRKLTAPKEAEGARTFDAAIPVTSAEARAEVKTMSHVTFLAGATAQSVVPEMPSIDPNNPSAPRGALSFFLARALEGRVKVSGGVARSDLFPFLTQAVTEATANRQAIQVLPQSEDASISGKQVFVLAEEKAPETPVASELRSRSRPRLPSPSPPELPSLSPPRPRRPSRLTPKPVRAENAPVRIAIVDGPATAFDQIAKGATAIEPAADSSEAELVWDVGKNQALAQGDVLMDNVDGSMIGSIADRVRTLTKLRAIGEGRPLEVKLASEGKLLTPGDIADIEVPNLDGTRLTVFNVAADATVQMIYPSSPDSPTPCRDPEGNNWHCPLGVVEPFGVDTLVAVTTTRNTGPLSAWLRQHDGKRDAAQVPDMIHKLLTDDPTARIGFVPVVTRAKQY